jgi:predicted phage tail protein
MTKNASVPVAKRRRRPAAARISGAKGGEKKPYQPYKAPDSALSIATVKLLYILSEGPIVGPVDGLKSVKLNGTPLISPDGSENFPGTHWDFRPGTVDQEHIAGFPAVENEASQGLPVELTSSNAWTRAINDRQLSAVRIRLSWPQIWELRSNGDQVGYRIDYAIDLSVDGASYQTVLSATLNDKGTTEYERSHRIDLPEGFTSALVRVRRLTANRNDSNWADLMRIKSLTEVIDAKLRYPNLALGGLQFDGKQFQDTPKFSLRARGRIIRVPNNYDPESRTYVGNWDGTFKQAYSNNPAWVWYDLLLHRRYGLGRRITADMVDRWTLYEIGRYCDVLLSNGKGGLEPRMTTNVYIQDQVEGYALLSDLASVFHGSSCWNGSMVTMIADIPGNEDGYVFTRSNVIGEFEYGAVAWPDRHTRAKVAWDNPSNEFKTQPVAVTNEEMIGPLGHRMLDVGAFGCTSEGQAMRHGVWALKSEQYESWSVNFTTGMEGRNVEPGQIICVADELLSGRPNGGRISAATKRVITIDTDAQIKAEDRLIINLPSGKSEGRIVKSVLGRQITVMADYSELPASECSWSVESADLAVMRFRVQTIEPQGLHQFKISAIQHEPQKYAAIDTGARIDPQPISIIPPGVMPAPTGITIASRSVVSQGIAISTMRITWASVPGAIAYNVEWRKDSGSWIRLPRTGNLGAEVEGIYSGRYVARVSAINAMDVSSIWGTSNEVVLKGKVGLPPAVSSLTATALLFGIRLKWGFPAGAEDTQRTELWYGPANNLGAATKLADLAYPQSEYSMQSLLAGARFFFWARLVDRTGNIGPFYPVVAGVMGQASSEAGPILDLISGQITESELGEHLLGEIDKISGDGPESVNGRIDAAKEELQDQIDGITDALEYVPTKSYLKDDNVRGGQRLYTAIKAVPANAGGANAPPNSTYWLDIGGIVTTVNAQTVQIDKNTSDISTVDGKITATSSSLQSLQASYRDEDGEGDLAGALSGWDSAAKFAEEVRTRATESEATTIHLTTLDAQVAGNQAGIRTLETVLATDRIASASRLELLSAKVGSNTADIGFESEARVGADDAIGRRIDTIDLVVDDHKAKIKAVQDAQVDADAAVASMRTTVEAVYTAGRDDDAEGDLAGALQAWGSTAKFAEETRVRADGDTAQARRSEQLEVAIGSTNAAVQTVSEAVVSLDGKARTMWSVKMQLNSQGQYVAAGIGLGIENGPAGLQSKFLISADLFAVVNGINGTLSSPFAVTGGQVFMNSAFIQDGTITNAKIGQSIQSDNYQLGVQGWAINKNGGFEMNGASAGGRMQLTPTSLKFYHPNGILGIDLSL